MPASEPATVRRVAELLRQAILRGEYRPGEQLPSRTALAEEHGVSPESAGLALRALRDEGLVSLEQGRGTYVRPLRVYEVEVTVACRAARPEAAARRLERALGKAARAEPSVRWLALAEAANGRAMVTARAGASGQAAAVGAVLRALREAGGGDWDWDGAAGRFRESPG